jgi:hypothetical protein
VNRLAAGLLALAASGFCASSAAACSCVRPDRALTDDEYRTWTLERAKNVVRGDIVSIQTGTESSTKDSPVVLVRMNVRGVLKGEARAGDVTLVTLFGVGDCGIGPQLLAGFGNNRELTIEVTSPPAAPSSYYYVDMCGYAQFGPGRPRENPKPQ